MTTITTVALIAVSLWLAILSIVAVLLVRQVELLTVRLDAAAQQAMFDLVNNGPAIGQRLSAITVDELPQMYTGRLYTLFASASCNPCRELLARLYNERPAPHVIVLITGSEKLDEPLLTLLHSSYKIIRDPRATVIANALGIKSMPFIMELEDMTVRRKAHVFKPEDFYTFVSPNTQVSQTTTYNWSQRAVEVG